MAGDCPTLQYLNVDVSAIENVSPQDQANNWLSAFEASVSSGDLDSLVSLFHKDGFWKDILALTWDMRTIHGHIPIRRMLGARFATTGLTSFHLLEDATRGPTIIKPLPDLVFIRFCFEFETIHGKGLAVAFLVPTSNGTWTAWSLLTQLRTLKAYPQNTEDLHVRSSGTYNESWEDRRRCEMEFVDRNPTVLIIGAGHNGLEVAARLACLGVLSLVIDRGKRVGDNWRTRYKSLHLHYSKWFSRTPYLEFPPTWPLYCPAPKLGDWLECYATALDLNVWLSSSIASATFDKDTKTWRVSVNKGGQMRTMIVKHLVFATGFGAGHPKIPDIPGKEVYRGSVLHSAQFTSAEDYEGKKVIVVGASNSGHDVAYDFSRHGWDVTMIQRSPTYVISCEAMARSLEAGMYNEHFPVEFADTLGMALPLATQKWLLKASTAHIANGMDKELLENLESAGFETYLGPDGAGAWSLILERGGGYYINTGASQEIINGNIKVKSSPGVRKFTEEGVELEDGTILEGDILLFATGFGDLRDSVREVCGIDVAEKVGNLSGLDAEGELQGVWRRTGHPRLWVAMSGLSRTRLNSLYLALQIKAIEEGIVHDGTLSMDEWN